MLALVLARDKESQNLEVGLQRTLEELSRADGKKQESHWTWQPQRLVSPQCGLTGLLNPTCS
jgi:hypothetical protein